MACIPCAGGGNTVEAMQAMLDSYPRADGTYSLATYRDCEGGYRGRHEGLSIFIVARNTKAERLFAREDLGAASDYMKTLDHPEIEKLPTASLCQAAVEAIYG